MKKLILYISFIAIIVFGAGLGVDIGKNIAPDSPSGEMSPTITVQEKIYPPKNLQIPKIGVQASIEPVGLDAQGRMDVPKKVEDVAWYEPGSKPGGVGNAVFAGHLDKASGAPAVFWDISKLSAGDDIIVNDSGNRRYVYTVNKTAEYPYNDFPLQEVFGSTDQRNLNLITCGGTWDNVSKNYSKRFVVYSVMKN